MSKREDGKETKNKVLMAACEVFAEKGYRGARVAEICKRAGANVASVNYYFGDKANLYVEAFRYAFHEHTNSIVNYPSGVSTEDKLRIYIKTIIKNFLDTGDKSYFVRLYLMEMANPTGLIDTLWKDLIEPKRKELLEIIREIMGKDRIDQEVLFCEVSVISQCKVMLAASRGQFEILFGESISERLLDRLIEHVADFSLAGIKAISISLP